MTLFYCYTNQCISITKQFTNANTKICVSPSQETMIFYQLDIQNKIQTKKGDTFLLNYGQNNWYRL